MENTMETTVMGYIETTGCILGLERITEQMETTINRLYRDYYKDPFLPS